MKICCKWVKDTSDYFTRMIRDAYLLVIRPKNKLEKANTNLEDAHKQRESLNDMLNKKFNRLIKRKLITKKGLEEVTEESKVSGNYIEELLIE